MSPAIAFALASLVFSGLVDLSYKLYSGRTSSRGLFLSTMGAVWLVLQLVLFILLKRDLTLDPATIWYGLAAGFAVTLSNLMLVECFTGLNVSMGSTIYRLNTIGVVVLAFLFLGEALPIIKLLGIGSGIVAVLFLYERNPGTFAARVSLAYLGLAVLASCFRASFGVISKAGLEAGANPTGILLIGAGCWMVGGLIYAGLRERRMRFGRADFSYSLIAGLLVLGTVNTLISGLEVGDASLVVPIANLGFLLALGAGVLLKMESLTLRKGVAMIFAVGAIVILSVSS